MELFLDILTAAAICAAIIFFISAIKSMLFAPIKENESIKTFAVIKVSGRGAELEQTVKSLNILKENGKMKIFIVDCGMDGDTRKMAEIISRGKNEIILCGKDEFENLMAEIE